MNKKQLIKMNMEAHPERPAVDFQLMNKKQLRNALHCRIHYLLASETILTTQHKETN
jgi:hypothetical protein